MNTENQLGKKIRELRKTMGFTQEKLTEYADINDKHLSKIENGLHLPTYKTLKKLSKILEFNLQDINITENCEDFIIIKKPIYQKTIKILNSAKTDEELSSYYEVLKLTRKIMIKNK